MDFRYSKIGKRKKQRSWGMHSQFRNTWIVPRNGPYVAFPGILGKVGQLIIVMLKRKLSSTYVQDWNLIYKSAATLLKLLQGIHWSGVSKMILSPQKRNKTANKWFFSICRESLYQKLTSDWKRNMYLPYRFSRIMLPNKMASEPWTYMDKSTGLQRRTALRTMLLH